MKVAGSSAPSLVGLPQWIEHARGVGGCVGLWPLDDGAGQDYSGYGNHLSGAAGPTAAIGPGGNLTRATQFVSASSQYLSIADNPSLSLGDIHWLFAITVYNDGDTTDYRHIASQWAAAGQSSWFLRKQITSGILAFTVSDNGSAETNVDANIGGVPSAAMGTNTWYHIQVWHDPDANTINIQVNNGTVASVAHTTGTFDSNGPFAIGFLNSYGGYWNGRAAGAGLWKPGRALTAVEHQRLYELSMGLVL